MVKGTYSTDDSPSDIAEIRLDKAVPLKVLWNLHVKYITYFIPFEDWLDMKPKLCHADEMVAFTLHVLQTKSEMFNIKNIFIATQA